MPQQTVEFVPPFIKLEQFLKLSSAVSTGGEAKQAINGGLVKVDGEICTMRGKKLRGGERVEFDSDIYICKLKEN
ncbi:MAG: RNA-binding S4 domain-containing protein [Bacteroides sp.]|nr:RNA-binding S4 domain-containing protein [Bacteroides sp.]